jgi:hypothetical protein
MWLQIMGYMWPTIESAYMRFRASGLTRFAIWSAVGAQVLGLLEQCPGVTDLSMPHMLIKGEQSVPEQQLQVLGRLQGLTLDTRWLGADVTSEVVQHVTSLKHLNLRYVRSCFQNGHCMTTWCV